MTQSTGGPTPRYEPKVTAGEHVLSAEAATRAFGTNMAAIREQLERNFAGASPSTLYWPTSEGLAVKRPGEDWQHYVTPRRRAGWYPRKPRGARP